MASTKEAWPPVVAPVHDGKTIWIGPKSGLSSSAAPSEPDKESCAKALELAKQLGGKATDDVVTLPAHNIVMLVTPWSAWHSGLVRLVGLKYSQTCMMRAQLYLLGTPPEEKRMHIHKFINEHGVAKKLTWPYPNVELNAAVAAAKENNIYLTYTASATLCK